MQNWIKFILTIFFLFFIKFLYGYEIIRDPIFENYIKNLSKELNLNNINTYLVKSNSANAFVLSNNIYITTGLLKSIKKEDTLKSIYLHEYAHILKNHLQAKEINIKNFNYKNTYYHLFSIGLAVLTKNADLGLSSSISLNSRLINEISKHSIIFEIEADKFMVNHLIKNEINTSELISFLKKTEDQSNNYFRTHPRSEDRINILKKLKFEENDNSIRFEWIKSKYSNNSNIELFNDFFMNLEKGIFNQDEDFNKIDKLIIQYEAFKKGIIVNNWQIKFLKLLEKNDNSFLKIEYINYLLDNNLKNEYYIIDNSKFDKDIMNEYFYYYIYGKYYNKIGKVNLSNFYFCQFYRVIDSINKADFFCKKYDIKDIPILDKSYALFK